jgi:hypothetical protein
MPKHRGLNRKKFLAALDYELLDEYFVQLVGEEELPRRVLMNEELAEQFLDNPANVMTRSLVLEHFQRMNDLAKEGTSNLVWAMRYHGISWDEKEKPENMALRLYLRYPYAFEHAYALYTWRHSSGRVSEYNMPGDFELTDERRERFQQEVRGWFASLAKGDVTDIRAYEQTGETVILVVHGSYVRTTAEWDGDEVKIRSFRPAQEDVLRYDPLRGVLRIKAALAKNRDKYVEAFAGSILEDVAAVVKAQEQPAYTLEPFQRGTFDFGGNPSIARVVLLEAELQLRGQTEPRVSLKSTDLLQTLATELPSLSLGLGDLTCVKLRFFLRVDGEEAKETIEIKPPERSDLASKKHGEVISAYLKEQGVKLI